MRNLLSIFFVLFILISNLATGQGYKAKFSEEIKLTGKNKGFTDDFIGDNDDYLFVLITDKSVGYDKQLYIQSIDKKSLKLKDRIAIYQSDKDAKEFKYRSIFKKEGGFIVFFEKETSKNQIEIHAMHMDDNLKKLGKKTKIYEFNEKEEDTKFLQQSETDNFVLLTQKYADKDERINVIYTLYDKDLKKVNTDLIQMDLVSTISQRKASRKDKSVLDDFVVSDEGELISITYITSKNDGETGHYEITFTNMKTGDQDKLPISLENAFFDEYSLILNGNELIVSGFYSDAFEKNKALSSKTVASSNFDVSGTFFISYDIQSRGIVQLTQAPFSKEFVTFISENNPATRGFLSNSSKNDAKEGDDISGNYRIREVIYDKDKDYATFYCEYTKNWVSTTQTTTANGVTTTSTTYYSKRGNMFYFRISLKDGSMQWYNSVRKYQLLSSPSSSIWYYKSMDVYPNRNTDVILYETSRIYSDQDKADMKGEKIKQKDLSQNFFTCIVDSKNGSFENFMPSLSASKVKAHLKIQLNKTLWNDDENTLYTINSRYVIKPGLYPLILFLGYLRLFNVEVYNQTFTIAKLEVK